MKKIFYLFVVLAFVSCQSGNKNKQQEKTTAESTESC